MTDIVPRVMSRVALNYGSKKQLTIVRGIPGSGKSTYAKTMASFQGGPIHLETDMYFERYGKYNWDPEQLARAHRWCLTTAEVLLQTRGLVVVSNTFTQYKEVFDYADFCARFQINLNVITMQTEFGSVHGVPEETMTKMRNRFEPHQTFLEKIRADFPVGTQEVR